MAADDDDAFVGHLNVYNLSNICQDITPSTILV